MHFHITFLFLCSTEGIPGPDMGINKYPESWTRVEFFYSILPAVWSIGRKYDRNEFDILRTVHRDIFVWQKPTRCTISQLYFDIQLYKFRTYLLSIIRSLNTVFKATDICHTIYVDCLLFTLYSSPNIVRVIKSRRMRWAGHVARMGEERGAYRGGETGGKKTTGET